VTARRRSRTITKRVFFMSILHFIGVRQVQNSAT
jgi:hypothetical protein